MFIQTALSGQQVPILLIFCCTWDGRRRCPQVDTKLL